MANATFNAAIDYFAIETGTANAAKVVSSDENRSKQSTSGPNSYDDAAVVDSWGEAAAPSSEYDIVASMAHTAASPKITLGVLIAAANSGIKIGGTPVPVIFGGLSIQTQIGNAPKIVVNGQAVHVGAVALRNYNVPAFTLSPRHRAQDFLGLCTVKKNTTGTTYIAADDKTDYGLESCNANFPIEFTLAQPKGETKNYDLHGGMATVDYTMNWYAPGEPKIEVTPTVTIGLSGNTTATVNTTVSNPVAKSNPKDGYTQYTWQVSFPLIGFEVS